MSSELKKLEKMVGEIFGPNSVVRNVLWPSDAEKSTDENIVYGHYKTKVKSFNAGRFQSKTKTPEYDIVPRVSDETLRKNVAIVIRASSKKVASDERFKKKLGGAPLPAWEQATPKVENTAMRTEKLAPEKVPPNQTVKYIVRLVFETDFERKRAIRAFYEDEDLLGLSLDSDDGETLLVPNESLKRLTALGIKFDVRP